MIKEEVCTEAEMTMSRPIKAKKKKKKRAFEDFLNRTPEAAWFETVYKTGLLQC